MKFFRRAEGQPIRLGILAGAFDPPTRAHLALGQAALAKVDEVLFVLPEVFPHKQYERGGFDERLQMLLAATEGERRFSVAAARGGLFIEIARECRELYRRQTELWFLCGRDAAERIVNWDYGRPGAFADMLEEFGLLVADRQGRYKPPVEMRDRIRRLEIGGDFNDVSSTLVRERIERREPWEYLVPAQIVEQVRKNYS